MSDHYILPVSWDPKLEADKILKKLVNISAPYVKGAHDGEFVFNGDYAYIVSLANNARPGENPFWLDLYSTLSIVNINTMETEKIIDFAKGGQTFANTVLPEGTCTVPRIIRKDEDTIRCFFVSENPGKRQSQMWYRDFSISKQQFSDNIYRAKIQTDEGIFDFQPQYFFRDARIEQEGKKPLDFGLFLVDSFKAFDGKTYVVVNNFFAQLNALAILHDDYETFEILGHFDKPYWRNLSESAVNKLPDGRWCAICRSETAGGNYCFTTSEDGRTWAEAEERPFIQGGDQSKPTFDRFNGIYYLGWQERTRLNNVCRSIFNIEVSKDCVNWERKYHFESEHSFQYPTFHEYNGSIWLTVTQGDTDSTPHAMYKQRIMFGKLEDL